MLIEEAISIFLLFNTSSNNGAGNSGQSFSMDVTNDGISHDGISPRWHMTGIITGSKNVPEIWYNDENGKKHRHYVDIFIPSQNKCIEVKSTWTAEKKKDNIYLKQQAAKDLGYQYEIWIYNRNFEKVNTIL